MLAEIVAMAGVHPQQRTTLDLLLCQYLDALGSTERIQKTPIPRAYTRHTSRFLLLWLLFLPFAIWPVCG